MTGLLLLLCSLCSCLFLSAETIWVEQSAIEKDLLIVEYWNQRLCDRLPVTYNHLLQGGYLSMPSARMSPQGEIAAGYSWVPPYHLWNLRFQLTNFLEVTGSYRVFRGIEDPILSSKGFGDLSDKGANLKLSVFSPEDSNYQLPGLAFGIDDFLGTRSFKAKYVVLTQVFLDYNMEVTLGYGGDRFRGLFGGVNCIPFRKSKIEWLRPLCLVAEYDAIAYKNKHCEPHPDGRVKRSPINYGLKYRLWDTFDLSLSYIRGDALAFSVSAFYNFGTMRGFLPKIDDPLPYTAPIVTEPIGPTRSEHAFVQDLLYAFEEQGFDLLETRYFEEDIGCCPVPTLQIRLINNIYRLECDVRDRISRVLSSLVPDEMQRIIVVMEAEGFPIQEYHFWTLHLHQYRNKEIGAFELKVLSPLCEVSYPSLTCDTLLFKDHRDWFNFELQPRTRTFFGSSTGKFKYCLGLSSIFNGYVWNDVYYQCSVGCTFWQNIRKMKTADMLNPSQLIQVNTDLLRYFQQPGVQLDQLYLQKNWALGKGWFAKASFGYFEEAYAGAATEFLYYPVNSRFAWGVEGAILKKRSIKGLGLTSQIRKLNGFNLSHRYFLGSQCFLNLYYDFCEICLDFKMAIGKFLANDFGARWEVSRYFPSGMRITMWYTITNGHDHINGHTYYDKGIGISMPFDIFYTHSDRSRWNYGMSAWLRDVGFSAYTGESLYNLIDDQRE